MFFVIDITSIVSVLFLVFMEGLLSIDNALVLALMVKHLPHEQQRKALTYGIWGAFLFRFIALFALTALMQWSWIKFLGGGYLLWMGVSHWVRHESEVNPASSAFGFWRTVVLIEAMDIAFSVDSILAAVAVSDRLWIVFVGGVLGIVMMRFAASLFVRLIKRFPKLEDAAYLLISVVGGKLVIQGFSVPWVDFHSSSNPAFWIFWLAIAGSLAIGLRQRARSA